MTNTVWYTRCPIPTASGIAFQRRIFDETFAGSDFQVRNIAELPPDKMETHFDHSLENSFREGGCAPPLWARSIGADTALVGITYIPESLVLVVRDDSAIRSVADLKGKRCALPVIKDQRINFMRFAALKTFTSALRLHGLGAGDVRFVDIAETRHKYSRINADLTKPRAPSSYAAQFAAVVDGEVDCAFGKAGEQAYAIREAPGKLRVITNLMQDGDWEAKICNATPRLLTVSRGLADAHPDAAIRYIQALLRAARWAAANRDEAIAVLAKESSVDADDIRMHFDPEIHLKLVPDLSDHSLKAAEVAKRFLLDHGFMDNDYSLADWARPDILHEAYARENLRWAA